MLNSFWTLVPSSIRQGPHSSQLLLWRWNEQRLAGAQDGGPWCWLRTVDRKPMIVTVMTVGSNSIHTLNTANVRFAYRSPQCQMQTSSVHLENLNILIPIKTKWALKQCNILTSTEEMWTLHYYSLYYVNTIQMSPSRGVLLHWLLIFPEARYCTVKLIITTHASWSKKKENINRYGVTAK